MRLRFSACLFLTSSVLTTTTNAWLSKSPHPHAVLPLQKSTSLFAESSASSTATNNNNNIILTPGESTSAFDSFKLGGARIHRYSQEFASSSDDSQTEYVMWYHGRSHEMNSNPETTNLPPLSTGRIGRATSRNGLVWEKDTQGSISEDAPDVSMGLNQDSWWGFDVSHVGLGNVLLPMSTPAVMTEGGVYLMFYHGGTYEETPIQDYLSSSSTDNNPSLKDATIQGMKMRIGVAVSQDGISWGRVEGDDPTGACVVPYDTNDPNSLVNADSSSNLLEEELYTGWPEVAVDLKGKKDDSFRMYYSTMLKETKEKCIGLAVSADGFRWTKKGIILKPASSSSSSSDDNNNALDMDGCARCCVIQDALYDVDTETWKELRTWKMYYEGIADDGKHRILLAESRDGLSEWNKIGLALDVGADGAWDCGGVGSPHIIRMDDGSERMYYTGQGADGSTAIGVAKVSQGSGPLEWVREQATFSFSDQEED